MGNVLIDALNLTGVDAQRALNRQERPQQKTIDSLHDDVPPVDGMRTGTFSHDTPPVISQKKLNA